MEQTIKGIFLKNIVKRVREKKGPEGLKALEKKYGDLKISAFGEYPLSRYVDLTNFASEIIYGSNGPEAQYDFGKLSFDVYGESILGKTMFSLLGNDAKKVVMALGNILGTVTPGLHVKTEDLGGNAVKVTMQSNPQHIRHYEGMFSRGLEYFGKEGHIESTVLGPNNYQYMISWK